MNENEYILELRARWPRGYSSSEPNFEATPETIALADQAVAAFPTSPKLWCMRGDLIQLGSEDNPHSLDDARACYQRATEIDPQFVEAWESLGHFHNAVLDDEPAAQRFFSEAERLKGHHAA